MDMAVGFQISVALIGCAVAIFYVGSCVVGQMERRNELYEAELRSKGVPLETTVPEKAAG